MSIYEDMEMFIPQLIPHAALLYWLGSPSESGFFRDQFAWSQKAKNELLNSSYNIDRTGVALDPSFMFKSTIWLTTWTSSKANSAVS
jgi:hypothetical protein